MASLIEVIENKNLNFKASERYAAILGESPSRGARSPSLWNAAFESLKLNAVMHPLDILPQNLKAAVACLRADKKFIGGAVTMPYKIGIIPLLDALEPEAERIGAVNCLYRDAGKLVGANTDGAGALWSLKKEYGEPLEGKSAIILGAGGAACAVAAFVAGALGAKGTLKVANRTTKARHDLCRRLQGLCRVENVKRWPVFPADVKDVDIIMNCTSVGFETLKKDKKGAFSLKFYTPMGTVDESIRIPSTSPEGGDYIRAALSAVSRNWRETLEVLSHAQKPLVFDIIYQPPETVLLYFAAMLDFPNCNGKAMNLEQAVIAFVKATRGVELYQGDQERVRHAMSRVK